MPWAKVLELLVVSRLAAPGSKFHLHRQGFDQSAMGDLLGYGFAVAEKDRLYRCHPNRRCVLSPSRPSGEKIAGSR